MKAVGSVFASLRMPSLPVLGRRVQIPVYVIHNGQGAEDYYFVFDFEAFVTASRDGAFVRPQIVLWAGRDDFERGVFARHFRESFEREFEAARRQLEDNETGQSGWFGWIGEFRGATLGDFAVSVVMLVAVSAGQLVWRQLLPDRWFSKPDASGELEARIAQTKDKVDAALQKLVVRMHPDLCLEAYRGVIPDGVAMEQDAWPLPASIGRLLRFGDGVGLTDTAEGGPCAG